MFLWKLSKLICGNFVVFVSERERNSRYTNIEGNRRYISSVVSLSLTPLVAVYEIGVDLIQLLIADNSSKWNLPWSHSHTITTWELNFILTCFWRASVSYLHYGPCVSDNYPTLKHRGNTPPILLDYCSLEHALLGFACQHTWVNTLSLQPVSSSLSSPLMTYKQLHETCVFLEHSTHFLT